VEFTTSSYPSQTWPEHWSFVLFNGNNPDPIRILLLFSFLIGLPSSDGDPPSPPPGAQRKLLPRIIDDRP
jgi:hypothetical protein